MAEPIIIRTRDDIYVQVPEGVDPDGPEIAAIVNAERVRRRQAEPGFKTRAAEQEAADRERLDPTKELNMAQKLGLSFGGGVDKLATGAKQIFGAQANQPSDAQIQEDRGIRQRLTDSTDMGVGPSWAPTLGKVSEVLGESAPFFAVPGSFAGRTAMALPRAAAAARAGVSPTARQFARQRGVDTIVGESALGAAQGAFEPVTSDESRFGHMAAGAAFGAALPGAAAAYRATRPHEYLTRAGREVRQTRRAGARLEDQLMGAGTREAGDQAAETIVNRIEGYTPTGAAADIPMTASQTVRMAEGVRPGVESAQLAAIELGTAGKGADIYEGFERDRARGVLTATRKALQDRYAEPRLEAARESATDPMRSQALQSAARWPQVAQPLRQFADDLRARSSAYTPQRKLADMLRTVVAENSSPQQLYEFRKLLADSLKGPAKINDVEQAIVRGAEREAKLMINAIDARLNEASRSRALGQNPWSDYLSTYSQMSQPVSSAGAQRKIYEGLTPPGGPLVGESPQITRAGVTRQVQAARSDKFGDRLDTPARSRVNDLVRVLRRTEEPTRTLKQAGTRGGGSQTSTQRDLGEQVLERMFPSLDAVMGVPVSHILKPLLARESAAIQREVAELMVDPQRTVQALRAARAARQPLTRGQMWLQNAIDRTLQTSTGEALTPDER